jgi:hypothetical protein
VEPGVAFLQTCIKFGGVFPGDSLVTPRQADAIIGQWESRRGLVQTETPAPSEPLARSPFGWPLRFEGIRLPGGIDDAPEGEGETS